MPEGFRDCRGITGHYANDSQGQCPIVVHTAIHQSCYSDCQEGEYSDAHQRRLYGLIATVIYQYHNAIASFYSQLSNSISGTLLTHFHFTIYSLNNTEMAGIDPDIMGYSLTLFFFFFFTFELVPALLL